VPTLRELQERRAFECRLTPDRALETFDDAAGFVRDRGLVTRSTDCAIPSLHEACHEEPYRPGSGGFGEWPRTKYPWGFQLAGLPDVFELKIHRGRTLFLGEDTAAIVDPICRAEIERMEEADEGWARLLRHLDDAGPSLVEDVQVELELKPKELKRLRAPLERCGAITSRLVTVETQDGGHVHTSELARWDQVSPRPSGRGISLDDLVVAGVRAAVLAPEAEPKRWFSWTWRWEADLVDRLVDEDRLYRPAAGWLAPA
jgi:hypothetical protein